MKKILIFSLSHGANLDDLSEESGVLMYQYYKEYFDEIYVISLLGKRKKVEAHGIIFQKLGSGSSKLDLLLSPFRLFNFCRKNRPSVIVTYEQIWLWWVGGLVKLLTSSKILLLPITMPREMYRNTARSLSGTLPIWLEKISIGFSYNLADNILVCEASGSYVDWVKSEKKMKDKAMIVDVLPEAIPGPNFIRSINSDFLSQLKQRNQNPDREYQLIYVGRLSKEKMLDHLIKVLYELKGNNCKVHLNIVGSGECKQELIVQSEKLGVDGMITFRGWVPNGILPTYLQNADCFVSPLTGGALREAALCGLPIIAYKHDWIADMLQSGVDYIGVQSNDYKAFAQAIMSLSKDIDKQVFLSRNIREFANNIWSDKYLVKALHFIDSNQGKPIKL